MSTEVAIVGIGMHEFGRTEGVSGMEQGVIAVRRACADAGVKWEDVQFAFGGSAAAGTTSSGNNGGAAGAAGGDQPSGGGGGAACGVAGPRRACHAPAHARRMPQFGAGIRRSRRRPRLAPKVPGCVPSG